MLINAYDTTAGKLLRASHHVDEIIKTLHLGNNLTPTKKENVFVITHATPFPYQAIAFPITLQTHTRKTITVYDERSYRDKNNNPTNPNDIAIMKLAAFFQQDVAEMRLTNLKMARALTAKAFASALTNKFIRQPGLDFNEANTLKTLLAFYVVCLMELPNTDLQLVGENVVRNIFGFEKQFILGVIEDVPHLQNLEELVVAIRKNPILYKLNGLTLKEMMALCGALTFTALGSKVVVAACEAPCLLAAFVYGAARFNKAVGKAPLGEVLNPKSNETILETFLKNIDYNYDLNG